MLHRFIEDWKLPQGVTLCAFTPAFLIEKTFLGSWAAASSQHIFTFQKLKFLLWSIADHENVTEAGLNADSFSPAMITAVKLLASLNIVFFQESAGVPRALGNNNPY